jgi:hypothetical protein
MGYLSTFFPIDQNSVLAAVNQSGLFIAADMLNSRAGVQK